MYPTRIASGWTFCPMSGLLGRKRDGQVARALADPRRAAHRAGAEALERRALVGEGGQDLQVVADELVVVLGVGHRRLEQLAPVAGHGARRVSEDRARLVDGLAADVRAHHAGLARGGAHVLGLGADDGRPTVDALGHAARLGRLLRRRRDLFGDRLFGATTAAARAALARRRGLVIGLLFNVDVGDRLGGGLVDAGLRSGGPLGLGLRLLAARPGLRLVGRRLLGRRRLLGLGGLDRRLLRAGLLAGLVDLGADVAG